MTAVVLLGCGGGLTVHGEVVQPARVPVRVFPRIVVLNEGSEESRRIGRAIADHLTGGRSVVELLTSQQLAAGRAEGRIRPATVVLRLDVAITAIGRPDFTRRDEVVCGPLGCMDERRPFVDEIPLVQGHLLVEVRDGPTDRSLQRESLTEEESGPDELALRLRVFERLVNRAKELVDQRAERVAVPLLPVDQPQIRDALDEIREGRWTHGRRALEAFVTSRQFRRLGAQERAWVLYDLGQATRFDPALPIEGRLSRAGRWLGDAVRLSPEPRIDSALRELDLHRRSRAMVRAQDAATTHNFALSRQPTSAWELGVPLPPSAYRE